MLADMGGGPADAAAGRVRANVVTVVAIVDLGLPAGLYALATLGELVEAEVAARVGVVALGHLPSRAELAAAASPAEASGQGVTIAATFRAIEAKIGCKAALEWGRRLQAAGELPPSSPPRSPGDSSHQLSTLLRQMPTVAATEEVTADFLKGHRKAKAGVLKMLNAKGTVVAEAAAAAALGALGLVHAPAFFVNGELHAGAEAVASLPLLIQGQGRKIGAELAAGQMTSASADLHDAMLGSSLARRLSRVPVGVGEPFCRQQGSISAAAELPHPLAELMLRVPGSSDRHYLPRTKATGQAGPAMVTAWVVVNSASNEGLHLLKQLRPWLDSDPDLRVALWMNLPPHLDDEEMASAEEAAGLPAGSGATDAAFAQVHLGMEAGTSGILLNGRWAQGVGRAREPLLLADLQTLAAAERAERAKPALDMLTKAKGLKTAWKALLNEQGFFFGADVLAAVVAAQTDTDVLVLPRELKKASVLEIAATETAAVELAAIVDPLSTEAHEVAALLRHLQVAFPGAVSASVVLRPTLLQSADAEPPLQLLYSYKLPFLISLDDKAATETEALTTALPANTTLTAGLRVPRSWAVELAESTTDLDNLMVPAAGSGPPLIATARYRLAALLLSGECSATSMDSSTGSALTAAGTGVELLIGTEATPHISDTTVMGDGSGYYQLRVAGFGQYVLYAGSVGWAVANPTTQVALHHEGTTDASAPAVSVALYSFRQAERALAITQTVVPRQDWRRSKRLAGLSHAKAADTRDTVHVFSLASGQLYERLLAVMMQSVRRNTRSPLKFWLLANYASPRFRETAPALGKAQGFEVEFVTYGWPPLLRQQSEKQRILWAYKILFLDVLFPVELERIIFLDADLTMHADIKELWSVDLHGAPYGYTPFCTKESGWQNDDTAGYRFWESGYWQDTLGDRRKYHISALSVIDLARLRSNGVADKLRATYNALSADPNSLSNLDQDLPNFAQTQDGMRIHSLEQGWLWCESWCSNATEIKAQVCSPITPTQDARHCGSHKVCLCPKFDSPSVHRQRQSISATIP
jgi:hypothetical protein